MNNQKYILAFTTFLVLLLTGTASAHFICGEVENSDGNVSASWFPVNIYFPESPSTFAECEVSPEGNKYCCDAEAIPPEGSWDIGDIVSAEVYSTEGFTAGPVQIMTTGEGYDVLPKMKLEKVIKLNQEIEKLIISNETTLIINASILSPYNQVELEENQNITNICNNCQDIYLEHESSFGMNELTLIAKNTIREFKEKVSFAIITSFTSNKLFICETCNGNKARANDEIEIKIDLNLSHNVSSLVLTEFIPSDWQIINSSGNISSYSLTHNIITWQVSGNKIERSYFARAPNIIIRPREYTFKTELEGKVVSEEQIKIHKLLKFFYQDLELEPTSIEDTSITYSIAPNRPLVIGSESFVTTLAVFPTERIRDARFFSELNVVEDLDNMILSYTFETNIPETSIERFYAEFRLEKSLVNNYPSLGIFFKQDGIWNIKSLNSLDEDERYIYYQITEGNLEGIAITSGETSFFDFFSN